MSKRIHLNNAGASLVSDTTLDEMVKHLRLEQEIGGYEAAAERSADLEEFYPTIASLLGVEKENVAFSDSATRAWNTVIFSMKFNKGDRILTTSTEFGSNVVSLQSVAEQSGAELIVLDVQENGSIDMNELRTYIDERLKLVAVSHAPAHCGSVINAEEIGVCLKDTDAFYLLDACQTLGQFDVDVSKIGCDALVGTGRKWLRGPRGTGFVFASNRLLSDLVSVSIDLANADWLPEAKEGSQIAYFGGAKKLQTWERSLAAQLGLANAVQEFLKLNKGGDITKRIAELRGRVCDAIDHNSDFELYPDGNTRSGVVTFHSKTREAGEIKDVYARAQINVSLMNDWDAPWDFQAKSLPTLVRVSPHYLNTDAEISEFVDLTSEI